MARTIPSIIEGTYVNVEVRRARRAPRQQGFSALAGELGHAVFAGDPHDAAFQLGAAAVSVQVHRAERERLERCLTFTPACVPAARC